MEMFFLGVALLEIRRMFLVDNLANVSIFLYPLSILDTTVVVLQVQNNLNAGPKDKRYHNNIE